MTLFKSLKTAPSVSFVWIQVGMSYDRRNHDAGSVTKEESHVVVSYHTRPVGRVS